MLPASQGRFRRAIAQSGAAHSVHSADSAAAIAEQIVHAIGVGKDLDALRSVPASAFVEAQARLTDTSGGFLPLPFQPTVDGHSLPQAPFDAVVAGEGVVSTC